MTILRLLRPLSVGLTASAVFAAPFLAPSRRLRCDAFTGSSAVSPRDWSFERHSRDARPHAVRKERVSPRIWRQISSGSILGVLGGLVVSTFSKPLAVLIGLLILGNQFLESHGIHIVPYNTIQHYTSGIDVQSALKNNFAFKLSLGVTFTLAAFAEF